MRSTKDHIAQKALFLFNEKGFNNVRLQHIADSAFVSVGHLAYYFKNKDAIVSILYHELKKQQEIILSQFREIAIFNDVQLLFAGIYRLQQQYRFFYLDTLEVLRCHPEIAEEHRALLSFQHQQIEFIFQFNETRKAFIPSDKENPYKEIAHIFSMAMDSWLTYQYINGNGKPNEASYCHDLWSLLRRLFTTTGAEEFNDLEI